MSRKKNTLKDLDEFLKQQAATLVTPESVSSPSSAEPPAVIIPPTDYTQPEGTEITTDKVFNDLNALASVDPESFRQKLYALIVQILEAQEHSLPEDKMMINTALYLKSGEHWKEAIRDYWKRS